MTTREWVEVAARTIDEATREGLTALGLTSADEADIEVKQEPKPGFLGMGGQDAIVVIRPKPKEQQQRRRSRGKGRKSGSGGDDGRRQQSSGSKGGGSKSKDSGTGGDRRRDSGKQSSGGRGDSGGRSGGRSKDQGSKQKGSGGSKKKMSDEEQGPDRQEQADIVEKFLEGLLDAFGLEGEVACRVEDDVIYADVNGTQTEALVGTKGSVMSSVQELCRTVVQRQSQANARIRLDIAGYNARRREALEIYAKRLADKVLDEGGEIMLEPMNAAERKVVHDAIVDVDGVRTFSEGQDPNRSVVIAKDDD
ncbi:MAG: RNA-binding cell elongation regulator Jag/EloR [Acidimicrobiia bacterium]|nr:RNA-binding cell elongation regulator Jag/EloR [Acidimicrobiia bacterium]